MTKSATSYDDAIKAALSGEYAAIYAYGVIGAYLSGSARSLALQAETAHRNLRDQMLDTVADPPAPAAEYAMAAPVTSVATALAAAAGVENKCTALWRAAVAAAGAPLVVVKFDRPNVDYQQVLYAALNQALQNRPGANFQVVAVSPTRGTAASVQMAQSTARRHAQDVMRTMTDMGVPATRLNVASTTDPNATSSEVRVFVR